MDLSAYSLEDMMISALKSEVDSKAVYSKLAAGISNAFLKEKMQFLADEEEKHRSFLEDLFKKTFPGKEIRLPDKTPVPLPEIIIEEGDQHVSEILGSAMAAERAARDFYVELAKQFDSEPEIRRTLEYFSTMEWGHYKLLEIERDNSLNFESYDEYWPMMHIGG